MGREGGLGWMMIDKAPDGVNRGGYTTRLAIPHLRGLPSQTIRIFFKAAMAGWSGRRADASYVDSRFSARVLRVRPNPDVFIDLLHRSIPHSDPPSTTLYTDLSTGRQE